MDNKPGALESVTTADVKRTLDHHCFTGGVSMSEVFGAKAKMTPEQYRELFYTAAKDTAMIAFPVLAITEYAATKLAEHGAEVLAKHKK